ncbi:MAG: hypothetical protein QOE82_3124, partial [Thermoanaerobaculia bacterium]|nr:hypothetical protein [Thermoanaerobaculia bacterium]
RIWSTHRNWPADWWHRDWLRIAEVIDDQDVQEWFREHAFRPGPNAAVIAWELRHFDADAAWRAAVAAFERGDIDGPEVMMLLNEPDAVARLIDDMPRLRSSALRAEIGRQLRLASNREHVTAAITALTEAEDAGRRIAGYELAGWIDWSVADSVIQHGAVNGGTYAVVQAAADAFVRRRALAAARQTLTSLAEAHGLRAWNDCEILIGTADALVLDEARDELCIWPALQGKPLLLRRWAADALDEARKKVQSEAKSRDRDREWL